MSGLQLYSIIHLGILKVICSTRFYHKRSFNYSIPKEGSSRVIGERNSMLSNYMKCQFNKTFFLLQSKKENFGKHHFCPDLGLLDPNLGHKCYILSQAAILCNIKESY